MDSYRQFLKYSGYLVLFAFAWLIASSFLFPVHDSDLQIAPAAGFKAPSFALMDLTDKRVAFTGQPGKPAIISLWASWCLPCKSEMPILEKVYREYHSRGLIVYGVNATNQDVLQDVEAFAKSNGITFPILLDNDGSVSRMYSLRALPTTFFIASDGTIHQVMVGGPFTEAFLRAQIADLFALEK